MAHPTSNARYIAPVALLVAVLVTILVVGSAMSDKQTISTPATTTANLVTHKPAKAVPRSYTVKPGDTLSGIADKTGVSLETIQTLNPNLDAVALHAGQKVKLVR